MTDKARYDGRVPEPPHTDERDQRIAALEAKVAHLESELQSDREYDARVPDPRKHKYLDFECCQSGCKSLRLTKELAAAKAILDNIDKLRADEGDCVHIPNDNPDFGGPNCVVQVSADFEDDKAQSFFGDTLAACLEKAVAAREARQQKSTGLR